MGIVGVTGLVGSTVLKVLEEYNFPVRKLSLFASEKSNGKKCTFKGQTYLVETLTFQSFDGLDFVFLCAGSEVSKKWALVAEGAGCYVIDNSNYFRMQDDISLIIPEVNFKELNFKRKLIANPNCSTIQSVLCLNALIPFGIKKVVYTTYQAVSGSGMKGINDLINPMLDTDERLYPYAIKDTCIPQIDMFMTNGYTKEEMKMILETRKILDMPNLDIIATCVRVPVMFSHGVSVVVELENDFEIQDIYDAFNKQENLIVIDNIYKNQYPTGVHSTGNDKVYIGRIRKDLLSNKSIVFYCVADNIRKGAASNAVGIAQKIIEKSLIKGLAQEN